MPTIPVGDDLRLVWALLLSGAIFSCAYRFARRRGDGDPDQAVCDAFLATFLTQYLSVGLPGLAGRLNVVTLSATAAACCLLLFYGAGKVSSPAPAQRAAAPARAGAVACLLFVVGYAGALAYRERFLPPTATDPLVYHLPTAVHWLQTGTLGIYPTWYWNPAASYCPLSGSMFMTWLMALNGNDVLARFVQVPPLLFLFFLAGRLCRGFGCGDVVAGLIAVAAVMSRPFLREAIIPKDDLFVTAFVGAAVLALSPENLRGRLGAWRLGVAMGLVLASKYTVLLACPIFLFLVDAPFRARWRPRHFGIAVALALLLAGPWYLRNVVLFHNPLYPVDVRLFGVRVFEGMFGTERDVQLRSPGGIVTMLSATYHSLPPVLVGMLSLAWVLALAAAGGAAWREPLRRACLFGPVAVFALFLVSSPHHEARYLYPLLLLWIATAGLAVAGWLKTPAGRCTAAAPLAVVAVATFNEPGLVYITLPYFVSGVLLASAGATVALLRPAPRLLAAGAVAASLVLAAAVYVFWDAYVEQYDQLTPTVWAMHYREAAPAWQFVREKLPPEATVAYANTYFVYPLYDFRHHRRVVHAPVRRGLDAFVRLPRLGDSVPGDLIVETMTRVMNGDADRATWMENLRSSKAEYLLVVKRPRSDSGLDPRPPESEWASSDPRHFSSLFDDGQSAIYQIVW